MQGIKQEELMQRKSALSGRFDVESGRVSNNHETPKHSDDTLSYDWETVFGSASGLKKGWKKQADRDSDTELESPQEQPVLEDDNAADGDADGIGNEDTSEDTSGSTSGDTSGDTSQDSGTVDPDEFKQLTQSTEAIRTTHDGQIIENLDLYVASGDAITVEHDNVIIRNVRVFHEDGNGINIVGASNTTIEYSEVIHSAPPSGMDPFLDTQQVNIRSYDAPGLKINGVIVRDGSSGIYLVESPGAEISNVEGYDFHGPYPRGQFVQFNKSGDSSLTNFYAINNPASSHPEDIISVYNSPGVMISNGLIDGNNSRSGVGVMFEGESQGGKVSYVDAINQGNGAFSSYSEDVEFLSTRSFDNIYDDQGRGDSSSNALIWNISADGVSILESSYTNPGNPDNIAWDLSKAATAEIYEDPDALPTDPISVELSWA
jgi:hypothetical protein